MDRVKYALIGFGGIAENRIAKEGFCMDASRFSDHPLAELVCATDVNGKRKDSAVSLGLKWCESEDEILSDSEIEAVYIATNNNTHAALAEKAILAGKHCIIEKPMATTVEDAQRLKKLSERNAKSLFVDHMMMKNGYNRLARERIRAGKIGRINDITLHMEFSFGSTPEEAASWRCSDPTELGGPLGDVASHCLYMAEFFFEENITELQCVYTPRTIKIEVENGAFIQFRTGSGRGGSIRVAFNQPRGGLLGTLSNLGYEIYGTEGVLRGYGTLFQISGHKDEPIEIRLVEQTEKGTEQLYPDNIQNIYQSLVADHVLSIRNNVPETGEGGLRNLTQVIACHESAQNDGKLIKL